MKKLIVFFTACSIVALSTQAVDANGQVSVALPADAIGVDEAAFTALRSAHCYLD